jgi:hypothetical protein
LKQNDVVQGSTVSLLWEVRFRRIRDRMQWRLAEKLTNDILFNVEMGILDHRPARPQFLDEIPPLPHGCGRILSLHINVRKCKATRINVCCFNFFSIHHTLCLSSVTKI